jgi:HEAT repeat protein
MMDGPFRPGAKAAIPDLEDLANDADESVRRSVREALAKIR